MSSALEADRNPGSAVIMDAETTRVLKALRSGEIAGVIVGPGVLLSQEGRDSLIADLYKGLPVLLSTQGDATLSLQRRTGAQIFNLFSARILQHDIFALFFLN